ncbi:MAG: hypothetical protein ABR589_13665, partial [Chthoniobacterales bacterium]
MLSRKAYAVLHRSGETLDGGTAAYQRIIGGLAVAALSYICMRKFRVAAVEPAIEAGELLARSETRRASVRAAWGYVLVTAVLPASHFAPERPGSTIFWLGRHQACDTRSKIFEKSEKKPCHALASPLFLSAKPNQTMEKLMIRNVLNKLGSLRSA